MSIGGAQAAAIEFLGHSEPVLAFLDELAALARVQRPVLIVGERGTGKELAAARLHYLSPRWQGPMVTLNCAALPENLVESELFGYEPGAFTGARHSRPGRFERADGGTLVLDEIGALALNAQEKLLRAVEYGVFEPLGASCERAADVRVVGATNADLPALAAAGAFKRDLLDRLSFAVLTVPPLREREDDIALLAEHFAAAMALELGRDATRFSSEAMGRLYAHPWPGNVRELKNVVERAVFAAEGPVVEEVLFDPFAAPWAAGPGEEEPAGRGSAPREPGGDPAPGLDTGLKEQVRNLELALVREALARSRHNQRAAAAALGLTYDQFRGLYRKYADELEPSHD